ncbi:MAG: glycosyltransferase family 39 protein [Clostridia bacterium]|nr:glycosyltransferase family 39 protein [Clostridia bacterium]
MLKNRIFSFIVYAAVVLLGIITLCALFIKTPAVLRLSAILTAAAQFIGVAVFFILYYLLHKKDLFRNKTAFFVCLFIITVIPRLVWVLLVDTAPISDFKHLHNYGVNASNGDFAGYVKFYSIFPFKFGYGLILALLYKLFGASVLVVKLFNIVLSVCLAFLIYWIGNMVFNEKSARTASILVALWPAQIMYSSVLASEHVFIVFFVLAIGLFIKYFSRLGAKGNVWMVITGIAMAAAQLVRPISSMLLPVFAVFLLLFVKFNGGELKSLGKKTVLIALAALGFFITLTAVNIPVEKLTGVAVSRASSGFNLMIGTNYKSLGMFNKEDFGIIEKLNYDFNKIHKEATRLAIERIKSNPVQFGKLAVKKFIIQWGDETYGHYWSTLEFEKKSKFNDIAKNNRGKLGAISQLHYVVVLIFAAVGCVFIRRNSIYTAVIFLLIFGGMAAAYTFLEVQGRYHFPAVPLFLLMAGYGLERMADTVGKYKSRNEV